MYLLDELKTTNFKAVCLVLDKRYDKWLKISEKAKKLGIDVEPFICGNGQDENIKYNLIDSNEYPPILNGSINYPTWWERPNAYNAWKGHYNIFRNAQKEKLDYLLLLEDDIDFTEDFESVLDTVSNDLPKLTPDWAMLYFGCYHNNNSKETVSPNIRRILGGGGFHGVLMDYEVIRDLLSFPPIGPYDWIAGNYIHYRYDCYAIHPNIIVQESGYSFVENSNLNKPPRDKI